jgi:uncharacterized protein YllA (UPF0747 family)
MVRRDNQLQTYVSDATAAEIEEMAEEGDKTEAEIVRMAIREFTDRDRAARIEQDVREIRDQLGALEAEVRSETTHTHKGHESAKASSVPEKLRTMFRAVTDHEEPVLKEEQLNRVIENHAGGDSRTKKKYKNLFRKRGLLFAHPGDPPVWTTETDTWGNWLKDYAQLNGPEAAEGVVEAYPAVLSNGVLDWNEDEISELQEVPE